MGLDKEILLYPHRILCSSLKKKDGISLPMPIKKNSQNIVNQNSGYSSLPFEIIKNKRQEGYVYMIMSTLLPNPLISLTSFSILLSPSLILSQCFCFTASSWNMPGYACLRVFALAVLSPGMLLPSISAFADKRPYQPDFPTITISDVLLCVFSFFFET